MLLNKKIMVKKCNYFLENWFPYYVTIWVFSLLFTSCGVHKATIYNPKTKIAPEALLYDFTLLQQILETEHPSIYWHTPKAIIDNAFAESKLQLKDSLNELQFRRVLSEVVSNIKCGHTSVRSSKGFDKWLPKANLSYFPFGARVFSDSIVLSYNLYRKDTILPRGTLVKSINGISSKDLLQKMYKQISTDGDAVNFKNIRISNNFPFYYLMAMDSSKTYAVEYYDSVGKVQNIVVSDYKISPPDTSKKQIKPIILKKYTPKELREIKKNSVRRLYIDTTNSIATLTINSFSGGKQKKFYRKTFKKIDQLGIKNIIFDVRNNGGGVISNSTLLTRYIVEKPFIIADSVFAKKKFSKFNRYIKYRFWYGLSMIPFTSKKSDGNYHFNYFKKKKYKPKKNYHFSGNIYAITGGYSFSATTLFLHFIQNQKNVTLVGEETGGGAYGNSAVYIPDITLPNSKIRIRLPIFRLVMDKNTIHTNRGIIPHYYVPPTIQSIIKGQDNKMEKVLSLIKLGSR